MDDHEHYVPVEEVKVGDVLVALNMEMEVTGITEDSGDVHFDVRMRSKDATENYPKGITCTRGIKIRIKE